MNVDIRLATIEDIPALRDLIRESVNVLGSRYYTSRQIASALNYVFGVDTQLIIDRTYFIAEVEKQIAGSGGWSKRKTLFGGDQAKPDQTDQLLDPATEAARIRAFYVRPQWARKGIGSLILHSCENAARAAGFNRIELVATLPGEPLYRARGYKTAEPLQLNTPDGESLPAFRMEKSFD
ncbi:MAG TPA: GNAT family N-acetyltransferase [Blastocatellia bacterium]|nr:GNAT family N-acetyltransferase [Blastocatellia bacterium]